MDKMPTHNPKTDTALGSAQAFHEYLIDHEEKAEGARKKRDALIIQARSDGVTAYRIAKALGLAESTVGRITGR
jgi:DNA-binding NarL/FixJ family response regulator